MRIAVCDDEDIFRNMIERYCMKFGKEFHVPISLITFKNGNAVLSCIQNNRNIDVFILDIVMKEVNGLQVAKEIRKLGSKAKIVFLTSALKYAPEGYKYEAKYYWMKPLEYSRFSTDLGKIYRELLEEENAYFVETVGAAMEKVYYSDIVYIETKGRRVCVHRKADSYISTKRLIDYESILDSRFCRCHAAYIVNMEHIIRVQGLEIELSNRESIYTSKGKKKSFLAALGEYLGKGME